MRRQVLRVPPVSTQSTPLAYAVLHAQASLDLKLAWTWEPPDGDEGEHGEPDGPCESPAQMWARRSRRRCGRVGPGANVRQSWCGCGGRSAASAPVRAVGVRPGVPLRLRPRRLGSPRRRERRQARRRRRQRRRGARRGRRRRRRRLRCRRGCGGSHGRGGAVAPAHEAPFSRQWSRHGSSASCARVRTHTHSRIPSMFFHRRRRCVCLFVVFCLQRTSAARTGRNGMCGSG